MRIGTPAPHNPLVSDEDVFIVIQFFGDDEADHRIAAVFSTYDDALTAVLNDFASNMYDDDDAVYNGLRDEGLLCLTPAHPWNVEDLSDNNLDDEDFGMFDWEARTKEGTLWYRVVSHRIYDAPTPHLESTPLVLVAAGADLVR